MEPLIRRKGLPTSTGGSCTWRRGRSRRRRGEGGEADQYQRDQDWPLTKATSPEFSPHSDGKTSKNIAPLQQQQQQQLTTNKVASIIMTPSEVGGPGLSCCRLNPRLDEVESLHRTTRGEDEGQSGNGSNKDNNNKFNIINNNNINNCKLRLLWVSEKYTCRNSRPVIDCPETMSRLAGLTEAAITTGRLCWPTVSPSSQEGHCLKQTKTTRTRTKTNGKNRSTLASCWSLIILILIAYELYVKARNYSIKFSCQRCLPDVVFIGTCSAQELLAITTELPVKPELLQSAPPPPPPPPTTTTTTISSLLKSEISSIVTKTTNSSPQIIEAKETDANLNNNNNNNSSSNSSNATIPTAAAMRSTTVNRNTINKHHSHQQQQQHNVLCNSRCNCVILEPSASGASGTNSNIRQQQNLNQPNQIAMTSPQRPPGGSSSSLQTTTMATTTTTTKSQQQQQQQTKFSPNSMQAPDVNESNFQLQQQQQQLEQALIAFNEDYSVDYEQQQQEQWLANGNGPDDAGAVDVVESNVPSASGNDRAPSRPADQSNAPASGLLAKQQGSSVRVNTTTTTTTTGGLSQMVFVDAIGHIENRDNSGSESNSNNNTNNNATMQPGLPERQQQQRVQSSVQTTTGLFKLSGAQLGTPGGLLQVNQSDKNQLGTNETNGPSNSRMPPDARVVVMGSSSVSSQQWQTSDHPRAAGQQHQQQNATTTSNNPMLARPAQQHPSTNKPGQQSAEATGMTLFPLPAHLHHRHHHYQPLGPGSGRESSGPQLYAQSLYSSQAPKLSYHAHMPYLKSSGGLQHQHQHQQQQSQAATFNQADLIAGLPMSNAAAAGAGSTLAAGATPAGHQYHHMRSVHLPHHLRQITATPTAGKRLIGPTSSMSGSATVYNPGSIQRLVPLRNLDLSNQLLDWNKTTSTANPTTAAAAAAADTPSSGGSSNTNSSNHANHSQLDWSESRQFAERIKKILDDIGEQDIQSLVLRNNNIQFELWSELYALLVHSMRQHLYHLDMSHNSLAKLGITFTGYIEHHLAAYGSWPSNGPASSSSSSTPISSNQTSSHINEIMAVGNQPSQQQGKGSKISAGRMRHTLLSGGKLYTQVQRLLLASSSSNNNNNDLSNTNHHQQKQANGSGTILLQQPMLLRALDLSHNKLKWLINDQFKALKHVQTIRLDYNRIRYINQHAFSGLESLRFLNLNFNRLQVIYIEQFQTNYNLLALTLRSNYLAYLRGGSFASLANLRRLDLSRNKLTIMSNNAFVGLSSLEMLNCSSNQFVHAPSASLHPLTSLRQLDLSDNSITQLAPGTFFHLPIEELWLNQNEQLVTIDRGAFWDLPYLRQLHLEWNPMLMSINSQAFVGTQGLQSIDVEGCQSLETGARQMLDNITMAATSRLLRYEQSRLNHTPAAAATVIAPMADESSTLISSTIMTASSSSSANMPSTIISPVAINNGNNSRQILSNGVVSPTSTSHRIKRILEQPRANSQLMKYSLCLAIVCLLAVALKLVFKFTSPSHYLEARRRRRRVYQAKSQAGPAVDLDGQSMSSSSGSSDNYPMCVQPDNHVIAAIVGAGAARHMQLPPAPVNYDQENEGDDDGSSSSHGQVAGLQQQQQQAALDDGVNLSSNENNEISVISDSAYCLGWPNYGQGDEIAAATAAAAASCCNESGPAPPGPLPVSTEEISETSVQPPPLSPQEDEQQQQQQQQQGQQQRSTSTIDLIHSQLIAAGFDYGHANCAHFYQSLGPALQLADMTASFVNSMDYY